MGVEDYVEGVENVGKNGEESNYVKTLDEIDDDKNYTTGQVARLTGLSQHTIISCFDEGRLKGHRVPSSRFRRIPGNNLREFVKKYSAGEYAVDNGLIGKRYTTGQVAKVCKISQQTIIRCFDSGKLEGAKVPGSKCRRSSYGDLYNFMRENDIPLGWLADYEGMNEEDLPVLPVEER